MMHKNRKFSVREIENIEVLARNLKTSNYTRCQGFRFKSTLPDGNMRSWLFLNDSINANDGDHHQEWAVGEEHTKLQIESLTTTMMKPSNISNFLSQLKDGKITAPMSQEPVPVKIDHPRGQCILCR